MLVWVPGRGQARCRLRCVVARQVAPPVRLLIVKELAILLHANKPRQYRSPYGIFGAACRPVDDLGARHAHAAPSAGHRNKISILPRVLFSPQLIHTVDMPVISSLRLASKEAGGVFMRETEDSARETAPATRARFARN